MEALNSPSSMIPALSIRAIILNSLLSFILTSRHLIIQSWSTWSKNPDISASTTQLIFFVIMMLFNSRRASWQLRPGRNPYELSRKSCSYMADKILLTAN